MLSSQKIRSFLLFVFALLAGLNVKAAEIETVELQLGVEYSGTMFDNAYFTFTPKESGKLVITGTGEVPTPYTDATFTTPLSDSQYTCSFVAGGKEMEMEVVEGTTYYLCIRNHVTNWHITARIADNAVIKVVSVSPEADKVFPLSNGGFTVISFDTAIKTGGAVLQTGATAAEVRGVAYGKDLSFELKETLFYWLKSGVMKAGDVFTLTVSGVCSAYDPSILYNGDGRLVLTYIASEKPAEVIGKQFPEKFLSYWPVAAEAGVAVIEFDAPLSSEVSPIANISFGSAEVEGDYYEESIPVAISGKTMTLDFRGKRRVPSDMVASGTDYGTMRLKIDNIRSADGNYVYSEGQGTFGSFQHAFPYEEVTQDLATEFTPASGASLAGVNSVELWLSNPDAVIFDGVSVFYKSAEGVKETVHYSKEECNYDNAGEDGITLDIPITTAMQHGTNVTITLANLVSTDGVSRDISAIYNPKEEFLPVAVIPEAQSKVTSLENITLVYSSAVTVAEDAKVPVMNAIGGTEVTTGSIRPIDGDSKSVMIVLDVPVTEAGYYSVQVPANLLTNEAGQKNEAFTLGYEVVSEEASSYVLTPADGTTVENLSAILVEYADGFGVSWNYDACLKDAAGSVVAVVFQGSGVEELWPDDWNAPLTTVKLTLQDPTTKEPVTITEPGIYTLEIPQGFFNIGTGFDTKDSEAITATYTIGTTASPLAMSYSDPENGASVSSLEAVTLGFDTPITVNAVVENPVTVTDRLGYTVFAEGSMLTESRLNPCEAVVVLSEKLSEPGIYMVRITAGAIIGEDGTANEDIALVYEIKEKSGEFHFTPENGATMESLKEITLDYASGISLSWNGTAKLYDANNTEVTTAECEAYIPEEESGNYGYIPTRVTFTLGETITAEGTYTFRIPAGYFLCGANYENSPELEVTFTVIPPASIEEVMHDSTSGYVVYDAKGACLMTTSNKADLKTLRPGFYIINGKKYLLCK